MKARTAFVQNLVQKLTHLGIDDDTPPAEQKYIILVNSIAALGVVVSVFYLCISASSGAAFWLRTAPPIATAVMYTVPLWLNHRRHFWAATTFMATSAFATHLAFVQLFGYAAGNHFHFLPILSAITFVYPPRHRRTATVFLVAALGVFIAIVLRGDDTRALVDAGPETDAWYYDISLVTVAVLIAFISYYSHRRTLIAEARVEERSRALERALSELQASQAQMIEAESHAMLGRVVSGLLHEVNSPLGSIRADAQTIARALEQCRTFLAARSEPEDPEARAMMRALEVCMELGDGLEGSTDRISRVVESFRQFAGLDEATRKVFDVRQRIDAAVTLLEPALGEGVEIARSYPSELQPVVGSPAGLGRALFALLQNAVNAVGETGVIRVTVVEHEGWVAIELADDGKGIPAAVLEKVFELQLTRKAGRMGMGLGLPMSKRNVEEMGGRLTIASIEGQGTTVHISLPAAAQN